ncbi:hypothetical protein WOLCODRAFT_72503 [Wolfiporia cocos MD-104 SS10]|uniref:DUF6593 domain-containing protein n=1 Tax=Wolfiporia cocos (strain MD-104) TaxID=742152 RepID=A0A2H3JIY6_WOLCO|nr:hypothetical protein WOLCODRAFT_72503 [Wolfiporia cocos MD-104 SS10]
MTLLEQSTVLVFDPDDMHNTSISLNGRVLCNVNTEHSGWKTIIHVRTAEGAEIASLQFRDMGLPSTKVRLNDEKPMSLGSWLHKRVLPFKNDVSFKDESGRQYKWKGNEPGRALEVNVDSSSIQPIAQFRKSYLDRKTDPHTIVQATLVMTYRAEEIRDLVVASFLLLERGRRVNERSVTNRADGLAAGRIGAGSTSR